MTDVEAILKRIEGIDPKDPAKLDEIWRLVSLRTAAYPVFQLPHLQYTRARNALRTIRPAGFVSLKA